ncbi:serine protease AprX [Geomicrobium halophilum]|uniref:Serine protease AprX n=1 Tax=Geomicrobium halophilum TaxID=549000 RepID=A0A841PLM0_9BACL|nr:S8 family peptidase [Geomicrobium halophilum]MBB6448584.1 serine protease AprX [Geomicrobium halophilum]
MFHFSTVKVARTYGPLIDYHLRHALVGAIQPLRFTPCFLQKFTDHWIRKLKAFPVFIKYKQGDQCYQRGSMTFQNITKTHMRCTLHQSFPRFSSQSGFLTAQAIETLCNDCNDIEKVYLDRSFNALLNTATETTRANVLQESGTNGDGKTIAILDTGVEPSPDLTEPNNRIVAFKDFINARSEAYDDNGHGTHCAGDAAGNGHLSDGKYRGPAPEANIVGVKVLDKLGAGSLSNIIAGIDWCIENQERYDINILSLSLGSPASQPEEDDPVVQAVDQAWEEGMVVCVAAGNEGPSEGTIASPGISQRVITVGALDEQGTPDRSDDDVASFSSRGPTIDGNTKPDILAPGVDITSLRSPNTFLDKMLKSDRVDDHYVTMSGTSMATPICAGVCAQLLELHSEWEPDEVKNRLLEGAEDLGLEANTQGQGSLDAVASADLDSNDEDTSN